MIAIPGVKVINYPANNAIVVTWDNPLKGKLRELRICSMRLGIGVDNTKIEWVRRLDCRCNYNNGHVEEYLEDEDIPKTKEGENVYCQFLFEPHYVIDEHTKKPKKLVRNSEREIGLSEVAALISLANAPKYKALLKGTAKAANAPVARV